MLQSGSYRAPVGLDCLVMLTHLVIHSLLIVGAFDLAVSCCIMERFLLVDIYPMPGEIDSPSTTRCDTSHHSFISYILISFYWPEISTWHAFSLQTLV